MLTCIALPLLHIRHHVRIAQQCLKFMIFIRNGVQFAEHVVSFR